MAFKKTFQIAFIFTIAFYLIVDVGAQPKKIQYGQITIRSFRSKSDSLALISAQKNIDDEVARKPLRQSKLDSLVQVESRIYKEAIVFKTIYRPSRDYIDTDSLIHLSDLSEIKRVTIYKKTAIPEVVFKCKNIEALELIDTSIKKLPGFTSLLNLKSISIYNNHSKKALRLSRNKIVNFLNIKNEKSTAIPRSFRKLKMLAKLDLTENKLTRFPNGIRHNRKLTEISLQRNLLTLNHKIKRNPYLERLSLHDNKIQYVPASIRNLKNIKKLNFNSNQISRVHQGIGELKKLEQLSFYNNQLTDIPPGVYQIKSLIEIDLFHNQIEKIDPGFCQWSNLITLYLSHNKLVQLPANIDTLQMLEGLYAWDNRLGQLPESLGRIPGLKYLRINNNYLKELPQTILKLKNLEELDISRNYMTEIPGEIFSYPKLKILAVGNNPWNEKTLKILLLKAMELRKRDVFVHLSDEN